VPTEKEIAQNLKQDIDNLIQAYLADTISADALTMQVTINGWLSDKEIVRKVKEAISSKES